MQIVSRSASFSYSLFPLPLPPSVPLLTAPPAPRLLAAPRVAGLLPARVSAHAEADVVVEFPLTREELQDQLMSRLGPVRSRAEMNAEIAALMLAPSARFAVTERPQ